jgi:hypothetical protein
VTDSGTAVRVTYWAEQTGAWELRDFAGINDFKKELAEDYISTVQGRPGDLGGLYQLAIEIVSSISLFDVANFLAQGIAFDLIKSGTKAFVLRPFLAAYKRLRERNANVGADIEQLRISFQDTSVTIWSIYDDSIYENVGQIISTLAARYSSMILSSGEPPFEIHVPLFEDPADDRLCRFRVPLDVDETVGNPTADYYIKFRGVEYDYARGPNHDRLYRVYDVQRDLLLDIDFYTRQRYWTEWQKRSDQRQ